MAGNSRPNDSDDTNANSHSNPEATPMPTVWQVIQPHDVLIKEGTLVDIKTIPKDAKALILPQMHGCVPITANHAVLPSVQLQSNLGQPI